MEHFEKNTGISSNLEDYLEAIAELTEIEGHAHSKAIAARLDVSTSAVTGALQTLAGRGLLVYRPHEPVVLTSFGAERAAVIRRRHQKLKQFFSSLLKLQEQEADSAACKIEHVIGETVLSRLVSLTEAVSQREDCTALRQYLEETMPKIQPDPDAELIPLARLAEGHSGVVVHVAENLRGIKKFADLGLVSGTLLQMEGHAPFGDLLRIKVMGSILSLRASDAMYIWIKEMI